MWIKIDKGVNDFENNIFLACVYNSPKNRDTLSFMIAMLLIG